MVATNRRLDGWTTTVPTSVDVTLYMAEMPQVQHAGGIYFSRTCPEAHVLKFRALLSVFGKYGQSRIDLIYPLVPLPPITGVERLHYLLRMLTEAVAEASGRELVVTSIKVLDLDYRGD